MSDTPGRPRKTRYIVLTLSARDKADNADALDELREVLRQLPVGVRVRLAKEQADADTQPDAAPPATEPPPVRNVKLEVDITNGVKISLDAKAAGAAEPKTDPQKAEEIKKGLWKWLGEKVKAGWKVTVAAALEWVVRKTGG